jgi:hypothetical protein
VYCTNLYIVQELQAEIEADAEKSTSDMLCDTANKSVVHLQQVHEARDSHSEQVYKKTTST